MFLDPRTVQQVAALPFVCLGGELQVLLVTSRRRGRWIVPKGWPQKHLPLSQCAALEAEEEAGVVGTVGPTPVGSYGYVKRMPQHYAVRCQVFVYPLLVLEQRLAWREREARRLCWAPLAGAAELVRERKLKRLLGELATDGGSELHALNETAESGPATAEPVS